MRAPLAHLPTLALLAATLALASCSLPDKTSTAPLPEASSVGDAAQRCAALAQTTLPRVRITLAELVTAGSTRAKEPPSQREVGEPLPEHCRLQGRIDERRGADREPYHTGFELRLPTAFSGRLLYQGGGGNDGVLNNAVGRNTGALGWADNALLRGFAAVSTDAGHLSLIHI